MQEKSSINKPLITVLTVNYNTADFIELMLFSFQQLTYNKYKVIICDNGSSNREIVKLAKIVQKYDNVEVIFRKQSAFGSIGHAEAMDLLVSKVETKYFVTMDSDAVFLCKSWDKNIISKFNDKIKVIGTALPFNKTIYKPMDFPLVFAVMYETKCFKQINPSFLPANIDKDKSKDTGWEIREKYIANNYKSIVFESKSTRLFLDTPFKHLICAVYYLDEYLIASHFGRGSSGGIAKYNNKWWLNIPVFSKFMRKYIGIKEKKEWIDICYKIIDKESSKWC